jgi:2-oxoglutarate ferredoxin oxidoreductase subunit delta
MQIIIGRSGGMNRIIIAGDRCKGCGLCVTVCPQKIIALSQQVNSLGYHPAAAAMEQCTACTACARICPDVVIEVVKGGVDDEKNINEGK